MSRIIKTISGALMMLLRVIILVLCLFSFSPIYKWGDPAPFSGDRIYNPYAGSDSAVVWKRATFHTHTKVDKGINECPYYPDVVYDDYMALGYDIVAFTNHNALTQHPYNQRHDLHAYEHGYNLFKLHTNVFGTRQVQKYDILLPIFDSQKQFKMDLAKKHGDFIVFNHPDRTHGVTSKTMTRISGYNLIEGDSGFEERDGGEGTHLRHWDEALSAGRYSHNLLSDDNHDSKRASRIARRSTWINTPTAEYNDVKDALVQGNFYSMRTPEGLPTESLPRISGIGINRDTIYLHLSKEAASIEVISQNGEVKQNIPNTSSAQHIISDDEPYIRMTARFDDGIVIYTNAFARYSEGKTPYREIAHPINWPLTILYNLILMAIISAIAVRIKQLIFAPSCPKQR